MNKILNIYVNIVKNMIKDELTSLASEMAFNFILAISPFIILLVAIFGLFSSYDVINHIIAFLSPIAPADALKVLKEALIGINQVSSGKILTLGFLGTIWAISNATDVIIKGLNRAYKVKETRPIWKIKGFAIFLILITALILFIAINLIIFIPIILQFLKSYIYIPVYLEILIKLIKWSIIFFTLFAVILSIYSFMPNIKEKNKVRILNSIPGTLFFCIFWSAASWLFGLYTENYGRFNQVYGALGAIIILIIWLYYTSLILLIGGEINSEIYKNEFG
ncbi:MAG: YihY/virulence factor BrkB family protein [Candidatus Gastranaerophilales bacterium]|nr:YihY/virulence factor BrkB family protein [Candidatus Gastranaerophilales bacterium]